MILALRAAKRAGGDRRGRSPAAALAVHREPWYDRTWADRWVDLRVDEHQHPVEELARLVRLDQKMTEQFLRSSMAKTLKAAYARRRKR